MLNRLRTCVLLAMVPYLLSGRECLHLATGFTLEIDSHETRDGAVWAKTGSGSMQIPLADIQSIEALPDLPGSRALAGSPSSTLTPKQALEAAALAQGVDSAFVRSVATVESGLRPNAVSPKGALGLMQLMPSTARELQVDPRFAESNALGGAKYLRQLLLQYKGDSGLALAAYNAGPAAVQRYKGIPPYAETRQYILKVLKEYRSQLAATRPVSKPNATN